MGTKLDRKVVPPGVDVNTLKYMGRPARCRDDFGPDVGIASMACCNAFGDVTNDKYYESGVVQANGKWYVILEWGRNGPGFSWVNGRFARSGSDFQFYVADSESDARSFFKSQSAEKNTKRTVMQNIGGKLVETAKPGKDGYIIQRLATRTRGLPDAYTIKDDTGLEKKAPDASPTPLFVTGGTQVAAPAKPVKAYHPEVISLARDLVGGTKDYARAQSAATGIVPTMDTIKEVRNDLIPLALERIQAVCTFGDEKKNFEAQITDSHLVAISKNIAALVPRPFDRNASKVDQMKSIICSTETIAKLELDLDAFEGALKAEKFDVAPTVASFDPEAALGVGIEYVDPNSDLGRWVYETYNRMNANRHYHLGGTCKAKRVWQVKKQMWDRGYTVGAERIASSRKGTRFSHKANLQPATRPDLGNQGDLAAQSNTMLGIHGTRSVNVAPILGSNFRLPAQLRGSGVVITGAMFGPGLYYASDTGKSAGYTSHSGSIYSSGGGGVRGRGGFMFLCDVAIGQPYIPTSTGNWTTAPGGCDSTFAIGGRSGVQNDEHIIYQVDGQRIRYVVEFDISR